jgi:hypothetical protein
LAGDENQISGTRKVRAMFSEYLAQKAFDTVSGHGGSDSFGNHQSDARAMARHGGSPIENETTGGEASAFSFDPLEIAPLFNASRWGKAKSRSTSWLGGHEGSDGCEAFAANAAAIGQDAFAAFAGIAIQKSVLAFTPDLGRLILSFHLCAFLSRAEADQARLE